ncbi:MAG: UDP-N-acetylmuramoyl-L-alanyl-D-glutamate--2,6-diaminopimelate ligase [bacterium]
MDLLDLQKRLKIEAISNDFKGNFIGISYNSRVVKPGDIFVAIRGEVVDGHAFLDEAKRRGAVSAIVEDPEGCRLPYIQVQDSRAALASVSALFYSDPSKKLKVIGITGTKGKTSVAWILGHILRTAGKKCAVLGTLGLRKQNGTVIDFNLTTPLALEIHREMKDLVDNGYDSLVMEVTAHGIHLKRILDVHFDHAIFTNIGQDHLDFFGWEDYVATKRRFFDDVTISNVKEGLAILNADDEYFGTFAVASHDKYLSYALENKADVTLGARESDGSYLMETPDGFLRFIPKVSGRFNLLNILAASASAVTMGVPLGDISAALNSFEGVPGRYQRITDDKTPFSVFVDYAHNPQSVEAVLQDARHAKFNRILAIVGCGGDRDKTKRSQMGRIARELVDELIITSDNPRSEDPMKIIEDIVVGVKEAESKIPYHVEPDREKAIALGVSRLKHNDALFILGKGHEDYQILATGKIKFDDARIARKYINRRLRDENKGENA